MIVPFFCEQIIRIYSTCFVFPARSTCLLFRQSGGMLARAVTIAVRYSAVRKQGFKSPSTAHSFKSEEVPILDHQIQLYRLAKQLAVAYALKFTGMYNSIVYHARHTVLQHVPVVLDSVQLPPIFSFSLSLSPSFLVS